MDEAAIPPYFSFGKRVFVIPWDYASGRESYEARSIYVERFWLPILGPSTTLLIRYLASRLEESPGGFLLDVSDTARAIGLSERSGKNAPFMRTVGRAIDYSLVRFAGFGRLEAKSRLPQLSERQLARLPASLRVTHRLIGAA